MPLSPKEDELDDEINEPNQSPIKNMKAMGHIGVTAFSSLQKHKTEKSSASTNKSIRSNSLAKNMYQFNQFCPGKELSNQKKTTSSKILYSQNAKILTDYSARSLKQQSFSSNFNNLQDTDSNFDKSGRIGESIEREIKEDIIESNYYAQNQSNCQLNDPFKAEAPRSQSSAMKQMEVDDNSSQSGRLPDFHIVS